MKSYAIYDEGLDRKGAIGYLFYYERAEGFIIELCSDLDEWEAPLLFQGLVRQGEYTIPHRISLMWVEERIIPSGRQNIGSILRNHKLQAYNEMALLRLSKGRCTQDSCYIEEVDYNSIPGEITERSKGNVIECFPTEDGQVICMFRDNVSIKVNLDRLVDEYKDMRYVLKNRDILDSVKVGIGGYSITFNDSIELPVGDLRRVGDVLPITSNDLYGFVKRNVLDTTQTCDIMQCSRQNLSYMVNEQRIKPIMVGERTNLYMRGDVERFMSE